MVLPPNFIEAYKWDVRAHVINNSGWGRTSTFWSNSPAAAGHFVCQSWKRFLKLGRCTPDMSYLQLIVCTCLHIMLWYVVGDLWWHMVTWCDMLFFLSFSWFAWNMFGAARRKITTWMGCYGHDLCKCSHRIWWLVHHSGALHRFASLCFAYIFAILCLVKFNQILIDFPGPSGSFPYLMFV